MKIVQILYLFLLSFVLLTPHSMHANEASAMSKLSDHDRLLHTAATFATSDERDKEMLTQFRKLQGATSTPDSTIYHSILKYGRSLMSQGRQAAAFDLITQLTRVEISNADDAQYTEFLLGLYLLMGASAVETGMMNLGLEYYTRGLSIAETNHSDQMRANFLNNIGVCYFKVKDNKRAAQYFKDALSINKRLGVGREIFLNYNNLAELDIETGDLTRALDNSLLALQQLKPDNQEDADLYFYMQSNIGLLYTKMKKFDLATSYLSNAITHQQKLGMNADLFQSYLNMAEMYTAKNQLDSALYYARNARDITSRLDNPLLLSTAMEREANIHTLLGQYKESASLIQSAYSLRDSLQMAENRNRMEQCQHIYEVERAASTDRSVMSQWNPVVVFFSMFAIVVVLIFILVKLFIYKRNKDRALRDKAALNREIQKVHEAQILESKRNREELQEALDLTHRQLTTFTLDKLKTQETLSDVISDLQKIHLEINPRTKELRERLQSTITKLSIYNTGDDWTEFHYYFEKVNPSFYRRLMEKHPSITEKEKRLCAFLSLGLSSKEIAQITFREVRSIESSRNRLRKKLNLPTDANLTDYCKEFTL